MIENLTSSVSGALSVSPSVLLASLVWWAISVVLVIAILLYITQRGRM